MLAPLDKKRDKKAGRRKTSRNRKGRRTGETKRGRVNFVIFRKEVLVIG
jgi:hypothetical protein